MWGFGEPTPGNSAADFPAGSAIADTISEVVGYSWGFGDSPPNIIDEALPDWGFGDPPPFGHSPVLLHFLGEYPDDGGDIVDIIAAYEDFGPYRVQLKEAGTGKIFPEMNSANGQFCNSGTPGLGVDLRPVTNPGVAGDAAAQVGDRMRFTLPPLPPGKYDVVVWKAGEENDKQTLPDSIEVLWRNRDHQTYRIRRRLSRVLDAHIRTLEFEPRLGYPGDD